MAQPDNTIDPNDLDSIDALLDEAEYEPSNETDASDLDSFDLPGDAPLNTDDSVGDDLDQWDQDNQKDNEDDLEQMLEGSMDNAVDADSARVAAPLATAGIAGGDRQRAQQEDKDFDDFLARRAQNSNNGNELTVAEMDSLKNMIIGFGSALIFLALIAIGVATWAALSSGGDTHSSEVLDEIRGEAEIGRVAAQSSESILKDLNRKLDALSFQIEQVNGDLVALSQGQLPIGSLTPPVAPVRDATSAPLQLAPEQAAQVVTAAPPSAGSVDLSKIEEKVDTVNRNLSVAQRRIVEINNRVSSLQQQHGTVLQTIKAVEKTMLEQQLSNKESADESAKDAAKTLSEDERAEKPKTQTAPTDKYRYQAPGSGFMYDAGSMSIYP